MSVPLMLLLFFLSSATPNYGCRILCSVRLRMGTLSLPPLESLVTGSRIHVAPTPAPAHSPKSQGHRVRKHHKKIPHKTSPSSSSPSEMQGCTEISCSDPLTSTPIGSPCGCVYPMQVELDLGVAPYQLFSRVEELEVEVAAGTFLKQSQVRIMGADGSLRDADKTTVTIDLVPLGEKFDKMTALLTYERFWQKKVPINMSLFGDYDVIYVHYPGLPSPPPISEGTLGPSGVGNHEYPFTANVHSRSTQKMNKKIIVIIALFSITLVSICLGVFCILWRWRRNGRPPTAVGSSFSPSLARKTGFRSILSSSIASSTSISIVSTMATCLPPVKTFSRAELEKATNNFRFNKILGEGGFGRVYHGVIPDGSEVAVKLLTRVDHSGDREFIAEVEMLSRLHHRNLVKLIGICVEKNMRCLVYEFIRNGSVDSHLHGCDKLKGSLDWDARLKIALGAARALAYLHEDSNPHVIHRDFKASNVLLEEDFTPKVSDFGLAREALEGIHHISTQVMGTFGYVAPEYAMTGHLLVKSDVYSYGVVLLELLSGRKPVDMSQPQGAENLVTWARPLLTNIEGLEKLIDPSFKGNYDFDKMAKVAAIASMCVHIEASQRPFMGEVVQALKLIYNDKDETCDGSFSCAEDSVGTDYDFKGEFGTEKSWWDEATPRLTNGCASPFVTMDYSSGPMEEIQGSHSTSNIARKVARDNRSGPLRTKKQRLAFYRLRGSMSEHGHTSQRSGMNNEWF